MIQKNIVCLVACDNNKQRTMIVYIKPRDGYTSSQLLKEIITQIKSKTASSVITWSYIKTDDGQNVIFHNPSQYTSNPSKNVVFSVGTKDNLVCLENGYWKANTIQPSEDMIYFHIGRLIEMLLSNFRDFFDKITIED